MTQALDIENTGNLFEDNSEKRTIHVRIIQRGRKRTTIIDGLPQELNFKIILKDLKKKLNCNGCIIDHPELGFAIQLAGDQRQEVYKFLEGTS
uniref:SUI1 domain-containing protein n=1 Tax=Arcella intermedia TaxID=1963864 RepID=A0A6B2LU41_9EUKA